MLRSMEAESWVALAQVLGSCAVFVLVLRLRPWRWLSSWVRRG